MAGFLIEKLCTVYVYVLFSEAVYTESASHFDIARQSRQSVVNFRWIQTKSSPMKPPTTNTPPIKPHCDETSPRQNDVYPITHGQATFTMITIITRMIMPISFNNYHLTIIIMAASYKLATLASRTHINPRRRRCRRRGFPSSWLKVGDRGSTHQFSAALPVSCCCGALRQSLASPVLCIVSLSSSCPLSASSTIETTSKLYMQRFCALRIV